MQSFLFTVFSSFLLLAYTNGTELLTLNQKKTLTELTLSDAELNAFPYERYKICAVLSQGNFYIDAPNDIIKSFLAAGNAWEPETDNFIFRYTKRGTIALDIGAHIGTHTIAMSKAVGEDGIVIAFEPNPKVFRELCMNLKLNGCTNVIPVQCALGSQTGEVEMCTPRRENEGGTFVGIGGVKVPLRKLDDFMIRNISFVKMDVENYEDMVLAGGKETLLASKPFMFLEIQGNTDQLSVSGWNQDGKSAATIAKLEALGYKVSGFRGRDFLAIP